ncbi:hypothetical protein ABC799_00385 [Streptococcus pneumoniae]
MSQEKYIMAIDQGTTSSRAIIFNFILWNIFLVLEGSWQIY